MSVSEIIYDVAKDAALKYLTEQVSMNDTIMKAAKECGYNSDMIDRICEAANHLVNEVALPKQANRYTEFELADPQRIKAAIHITEGVASVPHAEGPQQRIVENYQKNIAKAANEGDAQNNPNEELYHVKKSSHDLSDEIETNRIILGNANKADTIFVKEELKKLARTEGFHAANLLLFKLAKDKLPSEIIDYLSVNIAEDLPEDILFKTSSSQIYIAPDDELVRAINRLSINLPKMEALSAL